MDGTDLYRMASTVQTCTITDMANRARDRLLRTAEELFYAEGTRAVGIDRILAESGVGKASLYRHFESKDDLVIAVLQQRDESWRAWLRDSVDGLDLPSSERPLAIFDALAERFARRDFRGCAFINTMVEAADPQGPVHEAAAVHKRRLTGYVDSLLEDGGWADHRRLAEELVLLIDGAIVTALREGTPDAAAKARRVARMLLRQESRSDA